jgi:ATPase subunit of ABC transporter with duplicated ATPase domains
LCRYCEALVISHDRWFLNKIATHIMAYEGDSKVVFFEGGYDDYEEDRVKRLAGGCSAELTECVHNKKTQVDDSQYLRWSM